MNKTFQALLLVFVILSCTKVKNQEQLNSDLKSLDLTRGDIALCGSGSGQFGTVAFSLSCSEAVQKDFNLATALLHSFEYTEAEKVYARIIDKDPACVMAYWGAAMCSFHPLWEPPSEQDLQKGSRIIALARSLIEDTSSRESYYLEAVATIYDQWENLDYRTRLLKFEMACEKIFQNYAEDSEAAIFYSLALRSAADPMDKSFTKQKKAGEILNRVLAREPNHPGVTHYIIHTFDYPELAEKALPAARQYASIAAASAHAQHMPSHIFTRLGLWDEAIQSNRASVSAAQCYAENMGMKGPWDEELHGLDYLVYALLQKGEDGKAKEEVDYARAMKNVYPQNFKVAYSFAAMPARYSLERKDWEEASRLKLAPTDVPWQQFPWERASIHFARLLGSVHTNAVAEARLELKQLQRIHEELTLSKETYRASLVLIQVRASEGWIKWADGDKEEALQLLMEAADMEDSTEKHPVTPGEIVPARELLADMYMELGEPSKAFEAYQANLKKHPNRFNGLYGAGLAAERSGNIREAIYYYNQLLSIASESTRPEIKLVKVFLQRSI